MHNIFISRLCLATFNLPNSAEGLKKFPVSIPKRNFTDISEDEILTLFLDSDLNILLAVIREVPTLSLALDPISVLFIPDLSIPTLRGISTSIALRFNTYSSLGSGLEKSMSLSSSLEESLKSIMYGSGSGLEKTVVSGLDLEKIFAINQFKASIRFRVSEINKFKVVF